MKFALKNALPVFVGLMLAFSAKAQTPHRRDGYTDAQIRIVQPIDSLVVYKAKRRLEVYSNKKRVKYYPISLGEEPGGPKRFQGDMRTPEGLYYINDRSRKSIYHANLSVSYPSYTDSIMARICGQSPGGDIKIHGFPNRHLKQQEREFLDRDWTIGCVAIADWEIDELYEYVIMYCPILILP